MKKIFLIVGKSCTGKDTISRIISEDMDLPIALSFTTRPMRAGEWQGREYNFISEIDFWDLHGNNMLAEFTSYQVYGGDTWYYGLTREELEKGDYVLAIVNPEGAGQIKKIYGDKVVMIEIKTDRDERIKRYMSRGGADCIGECFRRILADEEDFEGFEAEYTIENKTLPSAVDRVGEIIRMTMAKDVLREAQEEFKKNPYAFLGE